MMSVFLFAGLEPIKMQMSGGHLLAAVETGGNTMIKSNPSSSANKKA